MRGARSSTPLGQDHRLGQERLDQVGLQRRDGGVGQRLKAGAGRDAHGFCRGFAFGARLAHAQPGAAIALVQEQLLAGKDAVRVADLLQVHAPQLGPAPRALEEQAGDGPQRVAILDGVVVGGIGGQLAQRHARLGHLVGRGALAGRHGRRRLGLRRQTAQQGGCRQQAPQAAGGRGLRHHLLFPVLLHHTAPRAGRTALGARWTAKSLHKSLAILRSSP
jgi:hypothetical protein